MASIFLVDDDQYVRYTLSKILVKAGHTVVCLENGRLALDQLRLNQPDLVITDVVMPELGGLEMLTQFRAFNSETPVLVVSAGSANLAVDFKETAAQSGANGVLFKPFDKATFLACVAELLR
jgi:CheY-like chemotaxis protein